MIKVARFRLRSKMRKGRYWEKEEKKVQIVWMEGGNIRICDGDVHREGEGSGRLLDILSEYEEGEG